MSLPQRWRPLDIVATSLSRILGSAERVIDAIYEKTTLLATAPELWRRREELAPRLSSFPVWLRDLYKGPVPGGIEVARVLHGVRDIPLLF